MNPPWEKAVLFYDQIRAMKLVGFKILRFKSLRTKGLSAGALLASAVIGLAPLTGAGELPRLAFSEVLDVVSSGTQMKVEDHLKRHPEMKPVYLIIGDSLGVSMRGKDLSPAQVFGQLQSDLKDHSNYEFTLILQEIWYLYDLYSQFYALNSDVLSDGGREPFVSFIEAIQKGMEQEAECRLNQQCTVLVATDGALPNPIFLLNESDLKVGP